MLHPVTPLWPILTKLWTSAFKLRSSAVKLQTPSQTLASSESSHMPWQTLVPSPIMHPLANSDQFQVLTHALVTCPDTPLGLPDISGSQSSSSPNPESLTQSLLNFSWTSDQIQTNFSIGPYPAPTLFPNIVIISGYLISSDPVLTVPVHTTLILCSCIPLPLLPPTLAYAHCLVCFLCISITQALNCVLVLVYKPLVHVCIGNLEYQLAYHSTWHLILLVVLCRHTVCWGVVRTSWISFLFASEEGTSGRYQWGFLMFVWSWVMWVQPILYLGIENQKGGHIKPNQIKLLKYNFHECTLSLLNLTCPTLFHILFHNDGGCISGWGHKTHVCQTSFVEMNQWCVVSFRQKQIRWIETNSDAWEARMPCM